jgi:mandelate racemase
MTHPKLTIRDLSLRAVQVPLARPLVTRVVTLESASLLLIDLLTEEGITGRAYLFGYTRRGAVHIAALLRDIAELTRGERAAPVELYGKLSKAFTLLGHQGLTTMAISGFDMACWDALAQAAGLPLVALLGGRPQDVPAYNSNGLGLIEPQAAAEQAKELLAKSCSPRAASRRSRSGSAGPAWPRTWPRSGRCETPWARTSSCPATSIRA